MGEISQAGAGVSSEQGAHREPCSCCVVTSGDQNVAKHPSSAHLRLESWEGGASLVLK